MSNSRSLGLIYTTCFSFRKCSSLTSVTHSVEDWAYSLLYTIKDKKDKQGISFLVLKYDILQEVQLQKQFSIRFKFLPVVYL